jgi:hypothetical protein
LHHHSKLKQQAMNKNQNVETYFGVVDANNKLVFQSKNEKEAKLVSYSYQASIVKTYKGEAKIN